MMQSHIRLSDYIPVNRSGGDIMKIVNNLSVEKISHSVSDPLAGEKVQ